MAERRLDRRQVVAGLGRAVLTAGVAGGLYLWFRERPGRVEERPRIPDWRSSRVSGPAGVVARGPDPAANVRRALAALGGMERFVSRGETVLVKPNVGWDRLPEQAANTDPGVVAELVRLCLAAGAARVVVADFPCNDPRRSFERSGVGPAVREAGGEVVYPPGLRAVPAELPGMLSGLEVMAAALEARRVINVPVVKQHSLSRATLGMKNWFGVLGGGRPRLHQGIHRAIAELGAAFRPTLTVVDATRILVANGPQGGSLDDVRRVDAVAAGTDPVALDAWGASLLGLEPRELGFIAEAERLGLGLGDPGRLRELGTA